MNILTAKRLDLDEQQGMNTHFVSEVTCDIDHLLAERDNNHDVTGKRSIVNIYFP